MPDFEVLREPSTIAINLLTWGFPLAGFYTGMVLRHYAFKESDSPTFQQRIAVGLPASLLLVSSFNSLLSELAGAGGSPTIASVVFITGFVMEQGLLIDLGLSVYLRSKKS